MLLLPFPAQAHQPASPDQLDGTFIQLWNKHGDWSASQWEELFQSFERMGLSKLVVQWTLHDETAYYDSSTYESVAHPPLELILEMADRHGMSVFLGLAQDSAFWMKIGRDPRLVEVSLQRLRLNSQSVARELAPLVRKHASFAGWYLSEEIDDSSWLEPERRGVLKKHLAEMAEFLHNLSPAIPVAISGFSKANCDPVALEGFWKDILREAPIDLVLFQDGIGAFHLELPYLAPYLAAMHRAVESEGRGLIVIVEVFQQVDDDPLNREPFRAEPASMDRILRQLKIAAPYSQAGMFAFSVPDYMSPVAGPKAEMLFESYIHLFDNFR
jgi:hypothetical protein